jgi:hypothetical protein
MLILSICSKSLKVYRIAIHRPQFENKDGILSKLIDGSNFRAVRYLITEGLYPFANGAYKL